MAAARRSVVAVALLAVTGVEGFLGNRTVHRSLLSSHGSPPPARPTSVAPVGPAPKAIILFTHLRRCGGSFVEDAVLKPHMAAKHLGKPLLCKEGELARHARLSPSTKKRFATSLSTAPLVWRHCPFGAHEMLGATRPYIYVTMLRQPFARMASWFAYCTTYSPDKCHSAPRTGASIALQLHCFAIKGAGNGIHLSRPRREMIRSVVPTYQL